MRHTHTWSQQLIYLHGFTEEDNVNLSYNTILISFTLSSLFEYLEELSSLVRHLQWEVLVIFISFTLSSLFEYLEELSSLVRHLQQERSDCVTFFLAYLIVNFPTRSFSEDANAKHILVKTRDLSETRHLKN